MQTVSNRRQNVPAPQDGGRLGRGLIVVANATAKPVRRPGLADLLRAVAAHPLNEGLWIGALLALILFWPLFFIPGLGGR